MDKKKVNYVGNKGGQGIKEHLLNQIVLSKRYFSLFLGGGGLETLAVFKNIIWQCSERYPEAYKKRTMSAAIVENDYKALIAKNNFTAEDFIFADPPYLFSTRRDRRKYYKFEFSDQDHIVFLNYMISIKARVLITHPSCELYDKMLIGWFKIPFSYQTRQGIFNDCMYLNYDSACLELVTYDYLGDNFIKRQQVKRKRNSMLVKINSLSFHERRALLNILHSNMSFDNCKCLQNPLSEAVP